MLTCGLKLTHDGAVALMKDNQLLWSIEIEKLRNNPRYSEIADDELISQLLEDQGVSAKDIDHWAIDGWGGYDQEALALQPRLQIGEAYNQLSINHAGVPYQLQVAQYRERELEEPVCQAQNFSGLQIGESTVEYSSYLHVAGHIASAYGTSPIARRQEASFVLVWDGGMYPRLYHIDPAKQEVENYGPLFLLIGNIYTIFSQHFGPYKVKGNFAKDDLSIAGKVMAYIAKGTVQPELLDLFEELYYKHYTTPMGFANVFANAFKEAVAGRDYTDEDILCSFHVYLEQLLISKLQKKIQRTGKTTRNLCMAGGCALNIKWNSAIRNAGFMDEVYVPPFPNDSGSALGVAILEYYRKTGKWDIDWSVYSGPAIEVGELPTGWDEKECSLKELAQLLHDTQEPVVFLNGNAELGPRALGNRSIIGAPGQERMKGILNDIKQRETYRPVSPMCLEHRAPEIFEPGSPDPFMLFDHQIRPEWESKIRAVRHLDNSARLQTISEKHNLAIFELLTEFEKISGIPVLCNTSANFKGTGFFPNVQSAMEWNGTRFVWSKGKLYSKKA